MKFNELPRGVFGIITLAPPVLMQSVDNQKVQNVNKKVPGDQVTKSSFCTCTSETRTCSGFVVLGMSGGAMH